MFNLFFKKKGRSQLNDWEVDLMLNTFKLLGNDYICLKSKLKMAS